MDFWKVLLGEASSPPWLVDHQLGRMQEMGVLIKELQGASGLKSNPFPSSTHIGTSSTKLGETD